MPLPLLICHLFRYCVICQAFIRHRRASPNSSRAAYPSRRHRLMRGLGRPFRRGPRTGFAAPAPPHRSVAAFDPAGLLRLRAGAPVTTTVARHRLPPPATTGPGPHLASDARPRAARTPARAPAALPARHRPNTPPHSPSARPLRLRHSPAWLAGCWLSPPGSPRQVAATRPRPSGHWYQARRCSPAADFPPARFPAAHYLSFLSASFHAPFCRAVFASISR